MPRQEPGRSRNQAEADTLKSAEADDENAEADVLKRAEADDENAKADVLNCSCTKPKQLC